MQKILQKLRWHGMSHGKIPLVCTIIFYVFLKTKTTRIEALADFFIFLLFSISSGVFGYLTNDLFDIEIDKAHGKKNAFSNAGFGKGLAITLLALSVSILFATRFWDNSYFILFWIIWILLAAFYSAKPLRLKERGFPGLMANVLSQYTVPVLLTFSAFDYMGAEIFIFALLASVSGFSQEIGHQRYDLGRDSLTDTQTYAVCHGSSFVDSLYRRFLILDILAIWGISFLILYDLDQIRLIILPSVIIISYLMVVSLIRFYKNHNVEDPYYEPSRQDILNIAFVLYPNFFLPFYLSAVLILQHYLFVIFFLFIFLLTKMSFPNADFIRPLKALFKN